MLQTEHEAYNGKCQMCRTLGTEYGYLYLLLYKVDCDSDMRRHVFVCPQENLTLAEETAAQYLRDEYDIDSEDEDTDVEVEYEHVTQIKSVQGYNVTARK